MITLVGGGAPAVASPDSAVRELISSTVNLCVLANVPEDTALRLLREAYAKSRLDQSASGLDQSGSDIDVFAVGQVLSEWHQNSSFVDDEGNPARLSIADGSFAKLCAAASGEAQPERILEFLVAAGAVAVDNDVVVATRRGLILGQTHPAAVSRAVRLSAEFASTLRRNLSVSANEPGLFERTVVSTRLGPRQIPSLLAYLNVHGQSFLEDLDLWMSARESKAAEPAVGVGVYLFIGKEHGMT